MLPVADSLFSERSRLISGVESILMRYIAHHESRTFTLTFKRICSVQAPITNAHVFTEGTKDPTRKLLVLSKIDNLTNILPQLLNLSLEYKLYLRRNNHCQWAELNKLTEFTLTDALFIKFQVEIGSRRLRTDWKVHIGHFTIRQDLIYNLSPLFI